MMSKEPFREKESNHIVNVLIGMILGGTCCLMILLNVNFRNGSGFEDKTLWDWLDLFLVPAFLSGSLVAAYWYTRHLQKLRAHVDQDIALSNRQEALMRNSSNATSSGRGYLGRI